jgi:CubicO group peptidase (beta-lactamase class C family)
LNALARAVPLTFALAVLVVAGSSPFTAHADVALVAPESVGFSSAGLKAFEQAMRALVDEGQLAGITTLVSRHGKVVAFDTYGYQDLEARTPLARNTIFRLASMTKPIVGVAMMMLFEEGKWKLDDPVAKYIPQFKDLKVATPSGDVAQVHPMTMRELMSHTAGFDVNGAPVYAKVNIADRDKPLQAMIDKLAAIALAAQPGTDWRYGHSVNIQGYIVEKLSGMPLDEFLAKRIFSPLKMSDTGFWVEPSKLGRVSRMHTYGPDKRITNAPPGFDLSKKPVFLSGSGGLLGTAEDYWRFSQMLLNGGQLDGARLLKRETVELMRTNVLSEGVKVDTFGSRLEGIGFGLDFAIVMDPATFGTSHGRNTFYWGGAFGTWFWIDPTNDVIVVGMIQNVNGSLPTGGTPPLRNISQKLVYQALTDRTK